MEKQENKLRGYASHLWSNKLWVGFLLVSFLLILSAIFRALTPPAPSSSTVISSGESILAKEVTFAQLNLTIPSRLNMYSQSGNVDLVKYAEELATKLNLEKAPRLKTTWVNEDLQQMVGIEGSYVAYHNYSYDEIASDGERGETSLTYTPQQAETTVRDFLDNHNILINYILAPTEAVNLEVEGQFRYENPNTYVVRANEMIDGIPYYHSSNTLPSAQAYVNNEGKISKILFYPSLLNLTKLETYSPLRLESIKTNVQNNIKTSYIYLANKVPLDPVNSNFEKIFFSSAALEYRQNQDNGYILPYVRFYGEAFDIEGNEYNVEAITPAIEVQ